VTEDCLKLTTYFGERHRIDGRFLADAQVDLFGRHGLAGSILLRGAEGFGLEAGSKPELMAVLALSQGGIVICNGYKDREYLRLALLGRKLGLVTINPVFIPWHEDQVIRYGMQQRVVGVRAVPATVAGYAGYVCAASAASQNWVSALAVVAGASTAGECTAAGMHSRRAPSLRAMFSCAAGDQELSFSP